MDEIATLYRLLARVWLAEVDGTLLLDLNQDELRSSLMGAGCSIPAADDPQIVEELSIDYCQLFIGPQEPLRPLQSVWVEGQLEGEATHSMREDFLPLIPEFQRPLQTSPDHLGIQLGFMAELTLAEVESELPQRFFQQHLSWTPPLTEAVARRAETDFYRTFSQLTLEFLAAEAKSWLF